MIKLSPYHEIFYNEWKLNPQRSDYNIVFDQLNKIIDFIPTPVYWSDINHVVVGISEYALKKFAMVFGDKWIGKTPYDLYSYDMADKVVAHNNKVMQTGEVLVQEETIKDLKGRFWHFNALKVPLKDEKNNIVGVINILAEISPSQENLFQHLKKIADLIPTPVYWVAPDSTVLGVNEYGLKILGMAFNDLTGKTPYDLYPKEMADRIVHHNTQVIKAETTLSQEETIIVQNSVKHFIAIKSPLKDDNNNTIGLIGTSIDITAQKEAEQREIEVLTLKTEHQQAILQEQKKFSKIVGQAVHDIRSPLTSLAVILEMCLGLAEEERTTLTDIATRINDIAANLLSYYRPERSGVKLAEKGTYPLCLALLDLLAEKRYQYYGRPVGFETDFQPGCHFVFAELEVCAFKCMLSNLINNAVDAFDDQPGLVTLGFAADDALIKITIQDNGKGMSEELINKILNNIAVTEGKADGHGIGLTQVHEMLQHNQGTIDIDSAIGKGTTIHLTFPRSVAPAWIAQTLTVTDQDTVVILDDEPSIHNAWNALFDAKAPDISLIHFEQVDKALLYLNGFAQKDHILLLTDYELLKQSHNGLDVIEQAQIKRAVLVTSHYANKHIQEKAIQLGVTILPKQLAADIPIVIAPVSFRHEKQKI